MNILESYTFSFDYHKDVTNGSSSARSQIVGLKFSETGGVPVTIRSARSGLARIIDRLLVMDIHLPALPGQPPRSIETSCSYAKHVISKPTAL